TDALKDRRTARTEWWKANGFRSLIAVPLVHGDTLIAVLALVGRARFPVRHREMLELFAAQGAVAIANARLYADSNARRVAADARLTYTPETRAELEAREHRAMLAVPLLVTGRALGALIVGDQTGRRFTAEEIARAEAFADQAALALENARLYAEAEGRRREAEVLAEVARTVGAALEPDIVLAGIAEAAREL